MNHEQISMPEQPQPPAPARPSRRFKLLMLAATMLLISVSVGGLALWLSFQRAATKPDAMLDWLDRAKPTVDTLSVDEEAFALGSKVTLPNRKMYSVCLKFRGDLADARIALLPTPDETVTSIIAAGIDDYEHAAAQCVASYEDADPRAMRAARLHFDAGQAHFADGISILHQATR